MDIAESQAVLEMGVDHAVLASTSVDASDPKSLEISLLCPPVPVRVLQTLFHSVDRNPVRKKFRKESAKKDKKIRKFL